MKIIKKICKICLKEFLKKPSDSSSYWNRKIFCSSKCFGIYKSNLIVSEETKAKMRARIISIETRNKMSETHKRIGNKPPKPLCKSCNCSKQCKIVDYRYKRMLNAA